MHNGVEIEDMLLAHKEAARANPGTKSQLLMVEFYCTWSPPCQYLTADYAAVSVRFASDNFKFAKVDADRSCAIAKTMQIDTSARSHQVPTVILFEDGVEVERRPKMYEGGKIEKCRINQVFIEEQFELQKRLTRSGKGRPVDTKKNK